jgi:hypothetical protein
MASTELRRLQDQFDSLQAQLDVQLQDSSRPDITRETSTSQDRENIRPSRRVHRGRPGAAQASARAPSELRPAPRVAAQSGSLSVRTSGKLEARRLPRYLGTAPCASPLLVCQSCTTPLPMLACVVQGCLPVPSPGAVISDRRLSDHRRVECRR